MLFAPSVRSGLGHVDPPVEKRAAGKPKAFLYVDVSVDAAKTLVTS